MKVARLAVLGVAVVAAGGAFVVANYMSKPQQQQVLVEKQIDSIATTEVLVAAADITLGTSLNPAMVTWQKWPKDGVANGYITRDANPEGLADIEKAIARSAFFSGEPIRESKLVRSEQGYMSAILPAGQRAVATNISVSTGAGGFILPNDRVDVIMTRRNNIEGAEGFITENILENIRVLAIDQTIEENDGEAVVVGQTATLQLSPEQTRILAVAQQMSDRLTLSLRSLADINDKNAKSARHLLAGEGGAGRVKMIRFGKKKEIITRNPGNDSEGSND